jgi:putative ABC transport system permease protein
MGFTQDFRFALRTLNKSRGFAAVAVLVFALGIGANTAIFSTVNAVLLRGFPYPRADELVVPVAVDTRLGTVGLAITYHDYLQWKTNRQVFSEVAVSEGLRTDLAADNGAPERVDATAVSEDFFSVLGAYPLTGRFFVKDDHLENGERRIIISEALWKRRFGADPAIVGRRIKVRGTDSVVIGVASRQSDYPLGTQIWFPFISSNAEKDPVDNWEYEAIARLAPRVSLETARAFVESVGQRNAKEFPAKRRDSATSVVTLHEAVVGRETKRALPVLLAAISFVLLIATANLANLLLNRAAARAREFSIRSALGASSARLVQQVLIEAGVLCVLGAIAAIFIAYAIIKAVIAYGPSSIPRIEETSIDARVLLFTLSIAALTAGLFALAPAWRITRQDIREALQQSGNAVSSGKASQRYREALVVAQVALSLMLLIAAGLLVKSFGRLQHVDPGVRTANLLSFELAVSGPQHPEGEPKARFIADFHRRVDAIPGVVSSGAVGALPMGGGGFYLGRSFVREGEPLPPNGTEYSSMWNVITPGFIKTTGLQLMAGRDFNDQDTKDSAPMVIISQTLAKKMFPNEDPLGRVIRSWRDDNKPRQIVGIVADVKVGSLQEQATGTAFVPHQQDPWGVLAYVVRTEGDPKQYVALVRSALNSMDPNIALARVSSMEAIHETALAEPKFNMFLIAGFSLLALMLATIGLFGVIAYAVSQRTREIGIRMALGAQKSQILALVMNRGVRITLLGLALGLGGSLVLSRALASILFDVRPTDVSIYGGLFVVLGVTAMLATYVPALRATRVEPLTALRYE